MPPVAIRGMMHPERGMATAYRDRGAARDPLGQGGALSARTGVDMRSPNVDPCPRFGALVCLVKCAAPAPKTGATR